MKIEDDVFLIFIKSLLKSNIKIKKQMSYKPLETSSTQKSL